MTMAKKKIAFKTIGRDRDGVEAEVELCVKAPSAAVRINADLYGKRRYAEAVENKCLLMAHVDAYLREREIWTDADQEGFDALCKVIAEGELKLKKGGVSKKEARDVAFAVRAARRACHNMLMVRRDIESRTAEAVENQARFEYLVAGCTFWDGGDWQGSPYFTTDGRTPSVDLYLERGDDEDALAAAEKVAELLYGGDREKTPEEAFLLEYGFVDADGRPVDKQGRLVDLDGNRVDDEGYLIDEEGRRLGRDGRPFEEVVFTPFLDDEGEDEADAEAPPDGEEQGVEG